MYVRELSVTDFRSGAQADLSLTPGVTVLVGANGQGKTNLVESLGYLATLSSHRVSSDAAMIRQGADAAIIRVRLESSERDLLAEVQINRSSPNRAQINRGAIKPRELPRYFSSILFAPEDLSLVRGEPSGRRRFLDELLVARSPRLAGVLSDYDKALRQRNGLLKASRGRFGGDPGSLDAWGPAVAGLPPLVAEQYRLVAGADQDVAMRAIRGIDPEEGAETDRPE